MAIALSEQLHDELWLMAEELAKENPDPTDALYIESLNNVFDLDTERVNAELGFRIPPIIMWDSMLSLF